MFVGADAAQVQRMILKEGGVLLVIGLAVGLAAAFADRVLAGVGPRAQQVAAGEAGVAGRVDDLDDETGDRAEQHAADEPVLGRELVYQHGRECSRGNARREVRQLVGRDGARAQRRRT